MKKVKYLVLIGVCLNDKMISLSEEAIHDLMPGASVEEANNFFNTRRSDERLIYYVEKHGKDALSGWQTPEICEVEEDENFTHKVNVEWDYQNDNSCETLEVTPIVKKELLLGKTPEEIVKYLKDIGVSFVEG